MLQIKDFRVFYGGKKFLEIEYAYFSEQRIGILGRNGAGKTTFLRALSNLIPWVGQVWWEEECRKAHQKDFLYLSDTPIFLPGLSMEHYFSWQGIPFNSIGTQWKSYFLPSVLERKNVMGELSQGERQKIFLLQIFFQRLPRKVWLLDEAFSSVSWETTQFFFEQARLSKQKIFFTSHDLFSLGTFSDKILFLEEGKVIAYDDFENILSSRLFKEIFPSMGHSFLKERLKKQQEDI